MPIFFKNKIEGKKTLNMTLNLDKMIIIITIMKCLETFHDQLGSILLGLIITKFTCHFVLIL
jgi:hypothetical protein